MVKKGKRGFKFTIAELEHLLDAIDEIVPIGNLDWEKVWCEHLADYPTMEQTPELLKRKFKNLFAKKLLLVTPLSSLCLQGQANFDESCCCYQLVDRRFEH
jgi:hypothetical protein